jgi:hypothetical protein
MWTTDNRAKYDRDKLRYPSDLTDAEWALVEPLIPPAKHGGRDREVDVGFRESDPKRPRFSSPRVDPTDATKDL